jgi:alkylation response protein AidB-like acyl-CoA dehydrogenase
MTTNNPLSEDQQLETAEVKDFRNGVVDWIKHNTPADPGFLLPQTFMEVGSEQVLDFLREWQYKVWSSGYLGMAWPKEYGGGGMPRIFQQIADEEMKRARVPICFNIIGLGWAGPLIIDTGTDFEKKPISKAFSQEKIYGARAFLSQTMALTWGVSRRAQNGMAMSM